MGLKQKYILPVRITVTSPDSLRNDLTVKYLAEKMYDMLDAECKELVSGDGQLTVDVEWSIYKRPDPEQFCSDALRRWGS